MATEPIVTVDSPGETTYISVFNSLGQVYDFHVSRRLFRALAGSLTPGVAATEDTDMGGIGESGYTANLDLALINNGPVVGVYTVQFMQQLGGSMAPGSDMLIGSTQIRVAGGTLLVEGSAGDTIPGYSIKLGMNVTSTLGNEVQLYAWVEYQGRPVTLGVDDTCVFTCFEHTSGVSKWDPTDPVNPAASNQFETAVSNPAFQDDTEYLLKAEIVFNGVTLNGQDSFPIIGSE